MRTMYSGELRDIFTLEKNMKSVRAQWLWYYQLFPLELFHAQGIKFFIGSSFKRNIFFLSMNKREVK